MSMVLMNDLKRMKEVFNVKENEIEYRVKVEETGDKISYYVDNKLAIEAVFATLYAGSPSLNYDWCTEVITYFE